MNQHRTSPDGQPARAALVIGVGNRCRADDGVGAVVAEGLAALRLPGVRVVEHSGEGTGLMALWEDVQRVLLVDAVSSGGEPGQVWRFDARARPIPSAFFGGTPHSFGVAEAVEMARVLQQLPNQLLIYGIEAADLGYGERLSAAVRGAVGPVIERVVRDLREPSTLQQEAAYHA